METRSLSPPSLILEFRGEGIECFKVLTVVESANGAGMGRERAKAGGSAMQGGARYQNQVMAWLAAKMLAERPAAPIAPRGKLTYIAAESREPVDDVLAGTDQ